MVNGYTYTEVQENPTDQRKNLCDVLIIVNEFFAAIICLIKNYCRCSIAVVSIR